MSRARGWTVWPAAVLVSLLAGGGAHGASPARSGPEGGGCGSEWAIVPSPSTGPFDDNQLLAVSAAAEDDAWAVGFQVAGVGNPIMTLVEHWDGTQWEIVPSPNPGTNFNLLSGVAAISPDDVWAVGAYTDTFDARHRPLSMHWDGSAWTVVPSPFPPASHSADLTAVSVVSSELVWAVGSHAKDPGLDNRALTQVWTGATWRLVRSPTPEPGITRLTAVDAPEANRVFAVGIQGAINHGHTMAMTWNGFRWRATGKPPVGRPTSQLNGVSALSHVDVWAVGTRTESRTVSRNLIEHFDGSTWEVVPTPHFGGEDDPDALLGVVGLTPSEVWAVGWWRTDQGVTRTLALQRFGSVWGIQATPDPADSPDSELAAIAATPAGDLWAVGFSLDPETLVYQPLIERRCQL